MRGRALAWLTGLLLGVMLLAGGSAVAGGAKTPAPAVKSDLGLGEALWTAAASCDKASITKLLEAGARVNMAWGPRPPGAW